MKLVTYTRMKNKEISGLYRRGKCGNYTWTYRINGEKLYFATQTNDEAEAIQRVRAFKDSPFIESRSSYKEIVNKFIKYKVDAGLYTERSVEWAGSALNAFSEFSGGIDPIKVTPELINKWRNSLIKKNKLTSVNIKLRALRSFFSWCVKQGFCVINPVKHLKLNSGHSSVRIIFCTKKQRDLLYNNSPNEDMSFILHCGFECGLRRDEIVNARRDWFFLDDTHPFLMVRQALKPPRLREGERIFRIKNKKERIIPLTQKFIKFLKKYLIGLAPLDFALKPEVGFGRAIYRYDYRRPYYAYIKSMNLGWTTPHVMRHTFASILLAKGADIYEVAKYMGNTVKVTEMNYAHLIPGYSKIERLHD